MGRFLKQYYSFWSTSPRHERVKLWRAFIYLPNCKGHFQIKILWRFGILNENSLGLGLAQKAFFLDFTTRKRSLFLSCSIINKFQANFLFDSFSVGNLEQHTYVNIKHSCLLSQIQLSAIPSIFVIPVIVAHFLM